jgi:hypothetical protein
MTGPVGGPEPDELELVAAALRADAGDVVTLTRVLTESLGQALPPGMVEVERARGLGDRLAGRPGRPVGLRVHTPERLLVLRTGRHGVEAEVHHQVRGVVLGRQQVGMDEWVRALAQELTALARRDAAARAALGRVLGVGD